MDGPVLVALLGFFGTIVTAAVALAVAIVANGKERKNAAEGSMEKTLRERLAFKDEQMIEIKGKNAILTETLRARDETIEAQALVIRELREGTVPE